MSASADTPTSGGIPVVLRGAGGSGFEGVLVDMALEADGCGLSAVFHFESAPLLDIGEMVELSFYGGDDAPNIELSGRVVFQTRQKDALQYRFQAGLEARTFLLPALNRREGVRVPPDNEAPIQVTVRAPGGAFLYPVVNDVSATGVSLLFAPSEERAIRREWELELSLRLPGSDAPLEIPSVVYYRRLIGLSIFYGIGFRTDVHGFAKAQKEVQGYVSRRQVELLAAARRKREASG